MHPIDIGCLRAHIVVAACSTVMACHHVIDLARQLSMLNTDTSGCVKNEDCCLFDCLAYAHIRYSHPFLCIRIQTLPLSSTATILAC